MFLNKDELCCYCIDEIWQIGQKIVFFRPQHGTGYVTNFDRLDSTDKKNEDSSLKGRSHWAKPTFTFQDVTETVHV